MYVRRRNLYREILFELLTQHPEIIKQLNTHRFANIICGSPEEKRKLLNLMFSDEWYKLRARLDDTGRTGNGVVTILERYLLQVGWFKAARMRSVAWPLCCPEERRRLTEADKLALGK